jgi:ParB family chromosome partitioning protein
MRRALGKGIGALIPTAGTRGSTGGLPTASGAAAAIATAPAVVTTVESQDQVRSIAIERIVPNPRQPRTLFSEEHLADLTRSIEEQGVLQPILVRTGENGTFELIAGERRWRASQRAGKTEIPALVREFADEESLVVALVENVQRADLGPMEEARAFRALIAEFALTQEEVSDRVGKSRSTIANTLRLLNLPESTQAEITAGRISAGHARAILALESEKAREALTAEILRRNLSVRDSEKAAKSARQPKDSQRRDPDVVRLEEDLSRTLGTKVGIQLRGGAGKGKVEIAFFSNDDLGRLSDILLAAGRRAQPLA